MPSYQDHFNLASYSLGEMDIKHILDLRSYPTPPKLFGEVLQAFSGNFEFLSLFRLCYVICMLVMAAMFLALLVIVNTQDPPHC